METGPKPTNLDKGWVSQNELLPSHAEDPRELHPSLPPRILHDSTPVDPNQPYRPDPRDIMPPVPSYKSPTK